MTLRQPQFKKIAKFLSDIFQFAAEHLFLSLLAAIFIVLLLGLAAFYKYSILPQKIEPEIGTGPIKFQEDIYQKVLEEWQNRGERFDAAKTKEYPDPFKQY